MKSNDLAAARERAFFLVSAIADVAPPGHPAPIEPQDASPAHVALVREYLTELRASVHEAMQWWEGRIEVGMQRHRGSRERAEREQFEMVPTGPASNGRVVAAVRQYWLRCAALNEREPRGVPPEQFVLGWLIDREPALVAVLGRWTYLPIGLDADGHWV